MESELNIRLSLYMKYDGSKAKEELEKEFYELLYEFTEKNDMDHQVYDIELQ